jgi:putative transferase (TIGR04331 family)
MEIIRKVIELTLPACFGDEFNRYRARVSNNHFVPGRLFVTGAATVNDHANFLMGEAIRNGERIVRVQHGSGYGTLENNVLQYVADFVYTAFFTWGWTEQNGWKNNFYVTPSPLLSAVHENHNGREGSILLVGTRTLLQAYHVDQSLEPSGVLRYRREKERFIDTLSIEAREKFLYRPYKRIPEELVDEAYFCSRFHDLRIHEGDMDEALLSCGLLVLGHPGTTLNIAMAANVPTICFWHPDIWAYAPEAEPFFAALSDARICFSDGVSAGKHVNKIAHEVGAWWQTETVQAARKAWARRFAYSKKFWILDWIRTLPTV